MPRRRQPTGRTATAASSSSREPSKRVKRSGRTPHTDVQTTQANQYLKWLFICKPHMQLPALAPQPAHHVQAYQPPAQPPQPTTHQFGEGNNIHVVLIQSVNYLGMHVSDSIKQNIIQGRFIELHTLLPPSGGQGATPSHKNFSLIV